jgi:hypothetical protein
MMMEKVGYIPTFFRTKYINEWVDEHEKMVDYDGCYRHIDGRLCK